MKTEILHQRVFATYNTSNTPVFFLRSKKMVRGMKSVVSDITPTPPTPTLPPPEWKSSCLELRPSSIPTAGNGVFSTKPIKAGTRLADYFGDEVPKKDFIAQNRCRYFYGLRQTVLDGSRYMGKNVSHYVNESANPNVELRRRGLYASVNIPADTELFLAYPAYYSRDYEHPA